MSKTLYLECYSGISGDMTVAALLDLGADREVLKESLKSLPVGGFRTEITRVKKSGLDACDFSVILEQDNHDHVMEYLHGCTLKQYTKEHGGHLNTDFIIHICLSVLDALAVVHNAGMIHRDISPDNIKFAEDGVLKLYDFGGAKLEKGGAASKVVYMKPGYTPLEQYSANGNQGPWTDVYAMAATMYYCISGKRLPEAPDRSVRKNQSLFEAGNVKVSKQIEKVLSKALEIYYEDRYQTMEEFSKALQEKDNRKKFVIPGITVGAVLVIGVSGILVATRGKQDKKAEHKVFSENPVFDHPLILINKRVEVKRFVDLIFRAFLFCCLICDKQRQRRPQGKNKTHDHEPAAVGRRKVRCIHKTAQSAEDDR